MILPLILSMALQSVDIGITDLGQKPKMVSFSTKKIAKPLAS